MSRERLNETAVINLNGSGNGSAKIGPLTARETWYPDTVAVSANNPPTLEAQCVISTGDINTKRFRDSCIDGSTGDSTGKATGRLVKGDYVWADWTGGDAGVQARMTVTGEKEV